MRGRSFGGPCPPERARAPPVRPRRGGPGRSRGRWADRPISGSVQLGRSVLDDARDAPAVQAVASLEEVELDEEAETDDLALQSLDQLDRALDGPARGQQVIDDEHPLPGADRVTMDLERVRAILEGVLDGDRLGRQ